MGGTWTTQNKVLPDVYINFKSEAQALGKLGERGILAVPAHLPWGKEGVTTLEASTFMQNSLAAIGFNAVDPRIRHIAAALSHVNKVLIYRLGAKEAVKASTVSGSLTATAKYGGSRGNDLKVSIQSNIDMLGFFNVITYLDQEEVDIQTVEKAEDLVSNDFVDFSGTGELTDAAVTSLEGGADDSGGAGEYTAALAAFEAEEFDVLAVPTEDSVIKSLATAYTKRLRENEGKKFQTVLCNYPEADHEGVISLKNGVVTADGLTVEPTYLVWEIAAMEAGANVNQSLTYAVIPNAVDVSPKYTKTELVQAISNGEMVLTADNGQVRIVQDINTLKTFTMDRGKYFSKNRIIRTLDAIANDISRVFKQHFLGKVSNDADGRNLFKAEAVSYLESLQDMGAIQNFHSQKDIEVLPGKDSDSIGINLWIQAVDSVEKIYISVTVR